MSVIFALITALSLCFGLAACNKLDPHTHNYFVKWDESYHWEECTVSGCTAKAINKTVHSFDDNNVCTGCGYVKGDVVPDNQEKFSVAGYSYVFSYAEIAYDGDGVGEELKMLKEQFERSMNGTTMAFFKDGSCTSTQNGSTVNGTYEQKGARLSVKINEQSSDMTVTGNSIIQTTTIPLEDIPSSGGNGNNTPSDKEPNKEQEKEPINPDSGNLGNNSTETPTTPENGNSVAKTSVSARSANEVTVTLVFVKGTSVTNPNESDDPSNPGAETVKCKHEVSNLYHVTDSENSTCEQAGWTLDVYVCRGFDIDHNKKMFCGKVFASVEAAAEDDFLGRVGEGSEFKPKFLSELYGKPSPLANHSFTYEIKTAGETSTICSVCGKLENKDIYYKMTPNAYYTYTLEKASGSELVGHIDVPYECNGKAVTSIGNGAFYGCTSLESVIIPESVTSIGYRAFMDCKTLTSVTICNGITSIARSAFEGCTSIKTATMPALAISAIPQDSLQTVFITSGKSIDKSAFSGCKSLESITLPFVGNGSDQTHFGYIFGATNSWDNSKWVPTTLKEVVITGGATIGVLAFSGCMGIESISIPDSVTSINGDAFEGCTSLKSITVSDDNAAYSSQDGILYNVDKTKLIKVPQTKTSVTIPNSVTSIGDGAFNGCAAEIKWGDNPTIEKIGGFRGYEGTSITIPDSVTSIDQFAFCECINLTSITIPEGVTEIGENAFYVCSNLTSVTFERTGSWNLYLYSNVESVPWNINVTDNTEQNAWNLKEYRNYFWKRSDQ